MLKKKIVIIIILFFVLIAVQLISSKFFIVAYYLMRYSLLANFILFLTIGFFIAKVLNSKKEGLIISLFFIGLAILTKFILAYIFPNAYSVTAIQISFNLIGLFSISDLVYILTILAGLISGTLLASRFTINNVKST